MKITYNVQDRKPFVKVLEEITGEKSVYMKSPTFAYKVGCYTITREGNVEVDDASDFSEIDKVIKKLEEKGFTSEDWQYQADETAEEEEIVEVLDFNASYPRETFTDQAIENLKQLVKSKSNLIKKALGVDELEIIVTEETVSLPWIVLENPGVDELQSCIKFIDAICHLARTQKRVNSKEKEVENEKYAFRCFLLRLGFIGDEFKQHRKYLLRNFKGSSAFKNRGNKDDVSK